MTGAGPVGAGLKAAAKPARSHAEVAYDFFRRKGLTKAQAAGVVGNLMQESSVRPGAMQEGGPGRGIAQWSVGGRWDTSPGDNLAWYSKKHRKSPWSLTMQLNFIWYELTAFPGYGLKQLRAARSVAAATRAFEEHYEVCGTCNEPRRIAQAQVALREYGA
ncbi:MAG TPA: phage tail tip lysozyme [Kofleriaceae bacterium]|nr:phage tail tip lysozyme [Kofleriaceae bacterium]